MAGDDRHNKLEKRMLSTFDWVESRLQRQEDQVVKIELHTREIAELEKTKASKDALAYIEKTAWATFTKKLETNQVR